MNHEPNPWAYLSLRLSEIEVAQIAKRGAVTGQIACRILEAVTEACDECVRFQQGAILTRRESRRTARATARPQAVPRLRRRERQPVVTVSDLSRPAGVAGATESAKETA